MKKRAEKKRRSLLKGMLIFELIVCYMALLNIVSHARGPQPYEPASGESLLSVSDFTSLDGTRPPMEQVLTIHNGAQGNPAGYWATLPLLGLDRILIRFQLECPVQYAGKMLIVDLYNDAYGYDREDQECRLVLKEGFNDISIWIEPLDSAPEEAQLRIFTVDTAGYQVEKLQIIQEIPLPKVSLAMLAGTAVCLLIFGITLILYCQTTKHV